MRISPFSNFVIDELFLKVGEKYLIYENLNKKIDKFTSKWLSK